MKRILIAFIIALSAFSVCGCSKDGTPDNILETAWDKAVAEYPFLSNFPEYKYDFQGVHTSMLGVEQYMIVDRSGSSEILDEYVASLVAAGFAEGDLDSTYVKVIGGDNYSAFVQFSSGNVIITFMYEKGE